MTIQEYIFSECTNAGMTTEGACALLGNIQEESAFRTNNLEDRANDLLNLTDEQYTKMVDSGEWDDFANDNGVHGGYGLIQVTLVSRKRQFLDFMKSRGKSISDLYGQVAFILWEMQHMYPTVWKTVTTSGDLYACTKIILDVYENPYEKTENLKRRYANAKQWYAKFNNTGEVKSGVTQNEAIKRVLDLARDEVGYHEKASSSSLDSKTANGGSGNWTKYARDLDNIGNFYNGSKNGYAWCDVFVDWLFVKCFGAETGRKMLCQPTNSAGAGCLYSAQYYKSDGRWVTQPQAGDQIFFSYSAGEYSHTGIVESVSNSTVNTIEGNSSDRVSRRSYPLSSGSIVGYGRPKWDLAKNAASSGYVSTTQNAANTNPSSVQNSTEVLRRGSTGEAVRSLQQALKTLGYDIGRYGADGDFGSDTFEAVKKFQKDHGIDADGEAGPVTMAAVSKALNEKTSSSSNSSAVSSASSQKTYFAVGDTVQFTGSRCYTGAAANTRKACKPGRALVINVNKTSAHPYHLCKINGFGSTVYGWVDYGDVRSVVS